MIKLNILDDKLNMTRLNMINLNSNLKLNMINLNSNLKLNMIKLNMLDVNQIKPTCYHWSCCNLTRCSGGEAPPKPPSTSGSVSKEDEDCEWMRKIVNG